MKLTIGPGALVAAAFIGPGTVTTCIKAGAGFGYSLIWALVFATLATIVLQSMSARLGVTSQLGLGEALMRELRNPVLKWSMAALVLVALGVGNAAYESGNLAGGALGVQALTGESIDKRWIVGGLSFAAGAMLLFGGYKAIEKVLVGLVIIMAIAFAGSAILVAPKMQDVLSGLVPRLPANESGWLLTAALIGTTIVPYNLFLHAATVRERWQNSNDADIQAALSDSAISIGLGGLISILILVTASASLFGQSLKISSAADMAGAIEPVYGVAAKYLVGVGMLAAGFTSAVTAPMATAYALTEMTGQRYAQTKTTVFRVTAITVLLIGTVVAMSGIRPVDIIVIAQIANGLLLPIIAASLLYAMNRKALLGSHVNGLFANVLGGLVVLATLGMGVRIILLTLKIHL